MSPAPLLAPPLRTRTARVLLAGFVVVHVVLALGPGPTPWWRTAIALLLIAGAAALLVLDREDVLRPARAGAALVLTVGGTAVVVLGLPTQGWPGYASWPLGAATMVTIAMTIRYRIGLAWITMGGLAAVCVLWSTHGGVGVLPGVGLIDRQAGTLLIGTLFAIGLRRAERHVRAFGEVERERVLERSTSAQELRARRDAVDRVLVVAGPTLRRIAAGGELSAATRSDALALEGALRDEIALAPLLSDALDQAMDGARRRGVDVVVLSDPDLEDLPIDLRVRAAEWLAEHLNGAGGSRFVGRAVARDGRLRVSAATDDAMEGRELSDER
jgi:hypothetical protein